jgi:flagellar hook protein FlgE
MLNAQKRLSVIGHNLANVQSSGFKKQLISQQNTVARGGTPDISTSLNPAQGPLTETGRALDLTVSGNGFLRLRTGDGTGYVSSGRFHVDADGNLVHDASGYRLLGETGVLEWTGNNVSADPSVSEGGVIQFGKEQVGTLSVATFQNPAGLRRGEHGVLFKSSNSGPPIVNTAEKHAGTVVRSGILEQSNTGIVRETTEMMNTQHAFRLNSRHFRVRNEMLQRAATLI